MTTPVRVPEEAKLQAQRIAALQGRQPGQVLADAMSEYIEKYREQFAQDFEEVADMLRSGNVDALAQFASRNITTRAAEAAKAAREEAS